MAKEIRKGKDWEGIVHRIVNAYDVMSKSINPVQLLNLDMTASQIKVLMSFLNRESFSMTELSKAHAVSVSTMTSMVDRLVQLGVLQRNSDEHDRRVVRVSLSEEGFRIVGHIMRIRRKELEKFLYELSDEEISQFVGSIENAAHFLAKAKQKLRQ